MLKSLKIENIAVIEKCNIDFSEGFNVLTGETGAGKSIVIDSINAVTGQRTSKELIRTGAQKATVSALFADIPQKAVELLNEYGISYDDNELFLLRTINSDGKNTCKINGTTVPVGVLREIGDNLLNIHGQHDNQALLKAENHCYFLDMFGNHAKALNDYSDCYNRFKSVRKRLKALTIDLEEKSKQLELYKFQANEIEKAEIQVGQLQELLKKREVQRNSEKIKETLYSAYSFLVGDDETAGAASLIAQSAQNAALTANLYKDVAKSAERLEAVSADITDISDELRTALDNISFNPEELAELEQRIDLITNLQKKYGGSEEKILEYYETVSKTLNDISVSDELLSELETECEKLEDELIAKAKTLSDLRKKTGEDFSKKICDVLKYLEMPNVVFTTNFNQGIYTVNGCDDVEFYISANKGLESKPLAKIASGGELSRIMLAIKSVFSAKYDVDTLIFDEIDTGISGIAADKVGRQIKALSDDRQIICVTHLAQIASAADNHLLISKSLKDGSTFTDVKVIENDERVKEIARIMSGADLTENLFKSAKEMIDNH